MHIEDIARAFKAVIEEPRHLVHGEAFNVGQTSENYRVREVADMVAEIVPNSSVTYADDASPDIRNYRVNCDKIINRLPSYRPKWSLRAGIKQIYQAVQEANLSESEFLSSRYFRVAYVKQQIEAGKIDRSLHQVRRAA